MGVWVGAYNKSSYEDKLIEQNPKDSQTAITLAHFAGATMVSLFIWPRQHNNNADAFRHCFWSALISKYVSPEWALMWTNAHEMDQSEKVLLD